MQTKPSSLFKKWLPAIVFALALHLVIIIMLWHSQKQEASSTVSNSPTATATESPSQANATIENLDEVKNTDVVATLTERSSGDELVAEKDTAQASETTKADSTAQANKLESDTAESTQTAVTNDNVAATVKNEPKQKQIPTPSNTDSAPDNTPPVTVANLTDHKKQNNVYAETRIQSNPNERLLLAGDLPKAQLEVATGEQQYDKAAQEVEQINAQLSATINKVKEQKMREIKAQQERNKAAHLQDQQRQPANRLANRLDDQISTVSEQLAVDKAAEAEFNRIQNQSVQSQNESH